IGGTEAYAMELKTLIFQLATQMNIINNTEQEVVPSSTKNLITILIYMAMAAPKKAKIHIITDKSYFYTRAREALETKPYNLHQIRNKPNWPSWITWLTTASRKNLT
ncbi:17035_t:CDS:2, partial [Gigaspora rosea]